MSLSLKSCEGGVGARNCCVNIIAGVRIDGVSGSADTGTICLGFTIADTSTTRVHWRRDAPLRSCVPKHLPCVTSEEGYISHSPVRKGTF